MKNEKDTCEECGKHDWTYNIMGENICMECANKIRKEEKPDTVCVLCGRPWFPGIKNRCECGGFCTWGHEKGGNPLSFNVHDDGKWSLKFPTKSDLKF